MRLLSALLVSGCAGPGVPCDVPPPADRFQCGSDFVVTPGLGEAAWSPLGDTLPLVRGPQGLQHVTLAFRLELDPAALPVDRAMITVGAWRVSDGAEVAVEEAWGVGLVADGDQVVVVDVRLVVPDPAPSLGSRVGVGVAFAPVGSEREGSAWFEGKLAWASGEP